jgi:hypothetical protein
MVSKGRETQIFFFTHQIVSESLHHMPDVPILQSLSDLRIVVGRSAAKLLGSQGSGRVAHGGVWLVLGWFEFEFEFFVTINNPVMCSDCQFKLG